MWKLTRFGCWNQSGQKNNITNKNLKNSFCCKNSYHKGTLVMGSRYFHNGKILHWYNAILIYWNSTQYLTFLWFSLNQQMIDKAIPDSKVHGGQHGAHLGPVGPRWAPCWPHEPCYQRCHNRTVKLYYLGHMNPSYRMMLWGLYSPLPDYDHQIISLYSHRERYKLGMNQSPHSIAQYPLRLISLIIRFQYFIGKEEMLWKIFPS